MWMRVDEIFPEHNNDIYWINFDRNLILALEERMDDEGAEYYCFYVNGILVAQNYWIESMKAIGECITENSDEEIRIGFHVNTENNGICTEIRKLLTNFLRKQKLL